MRQRAGQLAAICSRNAARSRWLWLSRTPLGRLFGFPLYLSPCWLLLAVPLTVGYGLVIARSHPGLPAPYAYLVGLVLVSVLVGSVLAHELGHALTSRRFGIRVHAVTVELLGGYTELDGDAPRPRIEAIVSLAGPAVSLALGLLGALGLALVPDGTLGRQLALQLAASNLVVAGFNLVPGLPLDGGRALQALVWAMTSDQDRGNRVAAWSGTAVAVASVVAAFTLYSRGTLSVFGATAALVLAVTLGRGARQALAVPRGPADPTGTEPMASGKDGCTAKGDADGAHLLAARETNR